MWSIEIYKKISGMRRNSTISSGLSSNGLSMRSLFSSKDFKSKNPLRLRFKEKLGKYKIISGRELTISKDYKTSTITTWFN